MRSLGIYTLLAIVCSTILPGCASLYDKGKIYRLNALRSVTLSARSAHTLFDSYLPIYPSYGEVVPMVLPSYFGYTGKRAAEAELKNHLNATALFLKSATRKGDSIPDEAVKGVVTVWDERLLTLLRLGDMDALATESHLCAERYSDATLRRHALLYKVVAMTALGRTTEAQFLLEDYIRSHGNEGNDPLLLSTRSGLAIAAQDRDAATRLLTALSLSPAIDLSLRTNAVRRLADLAIRDRDTAQVIVHLSHLRKLARDREVRDLTAVELSLWERSGDRIGMMKAWSEDPQHTDSPLWLDVMRTLRTEAYDTGQLSEAIRLHRRIGLHTCDTPTALADSIKYAILANVSTEIETIRRFEEKGTHPSPSKEAPIDTDSYPGRVRPFREIWGNVPNTDLWAMDRRAPAFAEHPTPTPLTTATVTDYQSALIRTAIVLIESIGDPQRGIPLLHKCIATAPDTPEAQHAQRLLSQGIE